MSQEVKVTIEWDRNTTGFHSDPMTVHFAGKAHPKRVIGAVVEAMGMSETEAKENARTDEEFIHIEPVGDKWTVITDDGEKHTFPSWQVTCDWIGNDYGNGKTAL